VGLLTTPTPDLTAKSIPLTEASVYFSDRDHDR